MAQDKTYKLRRPVRLTFRLSFDFHFLKGKCLSGLHNPGNTRGVERMGYRANQVDHIGSTASLEETSVFNNGQMINNANTRHGKSLKYCTSTTGFLEKLRAKKRVGFLEKLRQLVF